MHDELKALAATIRLLALDSDGVLTDGGVYVFEDGRQFRRFNIKDGLGIKRVMDAGIEVAVISTATTEAVLQRAASLGIRHAYVGVPDKRAVLRSLCAELGITPAAAAFMGDDLADLEVLETVGLPCAPADAVAPVRAVAKFISTLPGGYGAVRELCDLLVDAVV